MKKFIGIFILIMALTTNSHAQGRNTDLSKDKIKGEVKYIEEVIYDGFGELGVFEFNSLCDSTIIISKYNKKGNLDSVSMIQGEEKIVIRYKYGENITEAAIYENEKENGQIIIKYDDRANAKEIIGQNEKGEVSERVVYEYNEIGKLKESKSYGEDGKLYVRHKTKFDKKGNLLKAKDYNGKGKVLINEKYKYDNLGNQIEERSYNRCGFLKKKRLFTYDSKNRVVETIIYRKKRKPSANLIYKYDDKGSLVNESSYEYGVLTNRTGYRFEYDREDNWVKKITYDMDNQVNKINTRKIVYYGDKDENDYPEWDK